MWQVTQVFSCEFYEIFKNTFLTEHIRVTALFIKKSSIKYISSRYIIKQNRSEILNELNFSN